MRLSSSRGVVQGVGVVRLLKQLGVTRAVGRVHAQTTDSNHAHWRYPNLIRQLTGTHPD